MNSTQLECPNCQSDIKNEIEIPIKKEKLVGWLKEVTKHYGRARPSILHEIKHLELYLRDNEVSKYEK